MPVTGSGVAFQRAPFAAPGARPRGVCGPVPDAPREEAADEADEEAAFDDAAAGGGLIDGCATPADPGAVVVDEALDLGVVSVYVPSSGGDHETSRVTVLK